MSTIVVETLLGVPIEGGMLICGSVDWILFVTKVSLTNALMLRDQFLSSYASHAEEILT